MQVNHVRYSASLNLFLGVLLAACFLATSAHADSLFTGTFKLTNEVHWGNAVLSPGLYSLTLDRPTQGVPIVPIIIIRDAETGKIVAREFARPSYHGDSDDSKLLIIVRGNQRAVYAVRLGAFGEVFQTVHPFAGRERAVEEAHNAEVIPVQVAKK